MYDLAIIGAGVAGAFASLKISEKYPSYKTVIFDIGKAPGKRRRQLEGWFGSFPFSDGKLYPSNFFEVNKLLNPNKSIYSKNLSWVKDQFNLTKLIKTRLVSKKFLNQTQELNLEYLPKNYYQWVPSQIHQLSHSISNKILKSPNIECNFDTEIVEVGFKNKKYELLTREGEIFHAKKVLLAVGRSGWRWLKEIYQKLDISFQDQEIWYGVRIEMPSKLLSEMNKSHCELINDSMKLGPFSWNGTIIPEDHADLVISNFRSNEDRWRSDKVSFSLLNKFHSNNGIDELDRLGKLSYLLANDRVNKERIEFLLKKASCISEIPEYNYLPETIRSLEKLFPQIVKRGFFYIPEIQPLAPKVKINSSFEILPNLFLAGESLGIFGVLSAALTGSMAADFINQS